MAGLAKRGDKGKEDIVNSQFTIFINRFLLAYIKGKRAYGYK